MIEAGAPSAFVYFPLGTGLKIVPLGGYESFCIAAWIPLGSTGVIRGDIRNADVVADQPVSVLILPKEIYLRYWYGTYSPLELRDLLSGPAPEELADDLLYGDLEASKVFQLLNTNLATPSPFLPSPRLLDCFRKNPIMK